MKLGILFILIGITDIILTFIGNAWFGFPVRGIVDIALIVYGIIRIYKSIKRNKDGE